jgi:Holliday junction resolvasome RuvABC endonuclease subunit
VTREWVWGIDPAVSRLAFAFADVDSPAVHVETLVTHTDEREGARLGIFDRQIRIAARQWAGDFPPAAVFIEQPSGRFRNLQLTYAVGVLQAATFEALGCPVWTIPSGAWKRRTIGVGNATKNQVAAWVARLGVAADGQDECDAVAIACSGRAMFRARSWEAVA